MMLDATRFDRVNPVTGKNDPEGTQWVAEASDLGDYMMRVPPRTFLFENCPEPGMHRT